MFKPTNYENLFNALKQNTFMPSKNSVKISSSLEAKTYSSHIFPQKETSTQNPESTKARMGGFFERQMHLTQAIHTLAQGPALRGIYIISFRILHFLIARHSFYSPQPVLKRY